MSNFRVTIPADLNEGMERAIYRAVEIPQMLAPPLRLGAIDIQRIYSAIVAEAVAQLGEVAPQVKRRIA